MKSNNFKENLATKLQKGTMYVSAFLFLRWTSCRI